ncbi:MAG: hypothetical protein AAGA87_05660 [Pseudomonadota bacterium]
MPVTASAPGSILVTGEHAVVYGHPAIVAAIDQRVTVTVAEIEAPELRVRSGIADPARYSMDDLPVDGPYRFVAAAVAAFPMTGVEVEVVSEIDPTLGLGSSAAVTVAALGALARLSGAEADLHAVALGIVRGIQGRGSGADLAASLHGGCLEYRVDPTVIAPLPDPPPLALRYVGYKTPTGDVLARVAEARVGREAEFDALYAEMGACAAATIAEARTGWNAGRLLAEYQGMMARLGVSDDATDGIIAGAAGTDGLMACKISGSGLGDCVLAVGAKPEGFVEAPLAAEGLRIE